MRMDTYRFTKSWLDVHAPTASRVRQRLWNLPDPASIGFPIPRFPPAT